MRLDGKTYIHTVLVQRILHKNGHIPCKDEQQNQDMYEMGKFPNILQDQLMLAKKTKKNKKYILVKKDQYNCCKSYGKVGTDYLRSQDKCGLGMFLNILQLLVKIANNNLESKKSNPLM